MSDNLQFVEHFFRRSGWNCSIDEHTRTLGANVKGAHGRWTLFAHLNDEHDYVLFYSVCPIQALPQRRLAVAEFITRANNGLTQGNFELDFDDGTLRFKTGADIEDGLTETQVARLVYSNIWTMDRYFPALLSVATGAASALEAEGQLASERPEAMAMV